MSEERKSFLERVRRAVAEGNRAGAASPLPERGDVGYQGDGGDPVGRFCAELTAAGGVPHLAADHASARALVMDLVKAKGAKRALLGRGPLLDALHLAAALQENGTEVTTNEPALDQRWREPAFAADIAISGVDYLIAETGSVVLTTRPDQPRGLSLLPPVHIAVACRGQILPDLFDLFDRRDVPACLSIITGPSKTGDIELRLVTGVHGPGELHVVLITA